MKKIALLIGILCAAVAMAGLDSRPENSGGQFVTVVLFKCQRCDALMCMTGKTVAGSDGKTRLEYSCLNCRAGGLAENLYPMTLTRSVAEPVRLPAALTTNLSKLAELYITALPDKTIKWQYPKPGDIELGYREDGVVVWRTPPEVAK